ncbi:hypothetical protein JK361_05620 [Streptomyces sp. 5-8]|uniref:Polyketide beta-ketoacyl synthase n=1 Tax=Streptomyces musisoli TaxID=2802280 RepID=A0ABS1NVF0_9ACTN|nr:MULTISPECIES: hypothetical protein [Streptomyces]MBL1104087.1 hypothetical protein [Streptomyces musisoli]MBY8840160.1 hypothetical protein [Streptomyces sp. SP2-10]
MARVQVTSRLTWTFSARAGLVRAHRRPAPVPADRLPVWPAVLLRSVLRAARPRPVLPRAVRVRRARHR